MTHEQRLSDWWCGEGINSNLFTPYEGIEPLTDVEAQYALRLAHRELETFLSVKLTDKDFIKCFKLASQKQGKGDPLVNSYLLRNRLRELELPSTDIIYHKMWCKSSKFCNLMAYFLYVKDYDSPKNSDNRLVKNYLHSGGRIHFSIKANGSLKQTILNRIHFHSKLQKIIRRRYIQGYTLTKSQGLFCHPDGQQTSEKSYILEIVGVPRDALIWIADDIIREFSQTAVLVHDYEDQSVTRILHQ